MKECKKCNATPVVYNEIHWTANFLSETTRTYWGVKCTKCKRKTPNMYMQKGAAIKEWNSMN